MGASARRHPGPLRFTDGHGFAELGPARRTPGRGRMGAPGCARAVSADFAAHSQFTGVGWATACGFDTTSACARAAATRAAAARAASTRVTARCRTDMGCAGARAAPNHQPLGSDLGRRARACGAARTAGPVLEWSSINTGRASRTDVGGSCPGTTSWAAVGPTRLMGCSTRRPTGPALAGVAFVERTGSPLVGSARSDLNSARAR